MVVGRLSKKWPTQSLCLFCALRARQVIQPSSRQVHSSHKALYDNAAAQVKNQVSGAGDLYNSQQFNQRKSPSSEAEQDSGRLYGARYSSRKPPSWKTRTTVPQQSGSELQNTESAPLRSLQASRPRDGGEGEGGGEREGRTYQHKARESIAIRRIGVQSSVNGGYSQTKEDLTTSPQVPRERLKAYQQRETNVRRINLGGADRVENAGRNSDANAQGGQNFRRLNFQKAHIGANRDELGRYEYNEDLLATDDKSNGPETEIRNRAEIPAPNPQLSTARETPRWVNLPRRTEPPPEPDSVAATDEIVRFAPFLESKPRTKVEEYDPDGKRPNVNSTIPLRSRPSDTQAVGDSSSEYVGFRESTSTSRPETRTKAEIEPANSQTVAKPDVLSRESGLRDSRSKGRRRNFLLEEEDEKDWKSSKPKRGRGFKGQMEDEDAGLDPDKLERIEAKQRRKAERKAARDERASGQVFVVPSFISIGNLASSLKIRADAFTGVLQSQGFSELSNDHILDAETAGLIASELGFKAVLPAKVSQTDLIAQPPPKETDLLPPRPPIVTIMGHVDHGKTTLLDWLRNSSIAATEHGGITQHIGAFTVQMPSGRIITFLDTPGHAAFLEMRARGANVTDIIILVVAADDSVKPQTIEAIKHAKAARTQVVVAISKIDKPEADPDRVKQDLARNGIEVEDYGGDTQVVSVSGKTGQGMDQLEDAIIALADVLDVKAETTGSVEGWVLEAARKASGKTATVLVRRGTLRPGQVIVAGTTWARVRNLRSEAGLLVDEALPGTPVEIDGWDQQPEAGAEVLQSPNEQKARRVVDYRKSLAQIEQQTADVAVVNESRKAHDEKRAREKARAAAIAAGEEILEEETLENSFKLTEVPLIIRADVSGSIEAVNASVLALGNSEVRSSVVRSAVGNISESDIEYAAAVNGHIVNFNLPIDAEITRLAEKSGVKIIDGNIIYRITDDVKGLLEEFLSPIITQHVTGEAEILQIFEINLKGKKTSNVAGCKVRNGTILKGSKVKIIRGERVVHEGIVSTLKNVKKDVTEMRKGNECGIGFDDFLDFSVGDQVQCYETRSQKRRL